MTVFLNLFFTVLTHGTWNLCFKNDCYQVFFPQHWKWEKLSIEASKPMTILVNGFEASSKCRVNSAVDFWHSQRRMETMIWSVILVPNWRVPSIKIQQLVTNEKRLSNLILPIYQLSSMSHNFWRFIKRVRWKESLLGHKTLLPFPFSHSLQSVELVSNGGPPQKWNKF